MTEENYYILTGFYLVITAANTNRPPYHPAHWVLLTIAVPNEVPLDVICSNLQLVM